MRKILTISFWIAIVAGITSLFIFANVKQDRIICPEFEIVVDYQDAPVLMTQSEIRQEITREKIKVRGEQIGSIEAAKIQNLLDRNPYIKKATITIGVNGKVEAHLLQRKPIVRVIDQKGFQFYIDDSGNMMPVSIDNPARVVIASGNIQPVTKMINNREKDPHVLDYRKLPADLQKIYLASMAVRQDSFSDALIEQIYLNSMNEIELIPMIGQQSIIIGDTLNLPQKLSNLKTFYNDGMKHKAWNNYKVINLKFKNQIVCSKSQ